MQLFIDSADVTELRAATAIRSVENVKQSALAGSDCATLPPKIFAALYKHELTDAGVEAFLEDWVSTGQSVL